MPTPNRSCSGCTLCCKLVPVEEIDKPAGVKCQHVSRDGCSIYARRPLSCIMWACAWLNDPSTATLHRPDRTHYVIDIMRDEVTMRDHRTGEQYPQAVIQIWNDPAWPLAHRDQKLRDWLEHQYERHNEIGLVRFNNDRAMALIPPGFSRADTEPQGWIEFESNLHPTRAAYRAAIA